MMHRSIGVLDSGVGGISVLRELVALMPNENYIFYGDSRNAPYGTKSLEEVQRLTCEAAEYLVNRGIKALVVACNTATSAAINILRGRYVDIPVIGIEPALKPAVLASVHPRVLVMATPMTLREEKFHQLLEAHRTEAEIISLPCPGLVEFVERGELQGAGLESFLMDLLAEYREHPVDSVVLGCTHYPFVKNTIRKVLGEQVQIFDGGAGTARETRRRLEECGLRSTSAEQGQIWIENSLHAPETVDLSRQLLDFS